MHVCMYGVSVHEAVISAHDDELRLALSLFGWKKISRKPSPLTWPNLPLGSFGCLSLWQLLSPVASARDTPGEAQCCVKKCAMRTVLHAPATAITWFNTFTLRLAITLCSCSWPSTTSLISRELTELSLPTIVSPSGVVTWKMCACDVLRINKDLFRSKRLACVSYALLHRACIAMNTKLDASQTLERYHRFADAR